MRSSGFQFDARVCGLVIVAVLTTIGFGLLGISAARASAAAALPASTMELRQVGANERLRDCVIFERVAREPSPVTTAR